MPIIPDPPGSIVQDPAAVAVFVRTIPRFRYARGDFGLTGSPEDFLALPAGRKFKLLEFFFASSGELADARMHVRSGTTPLYSKTLTGAPWFVHEKDTLAIRTTTAMEIFNIFFQSGYAGTQSYAGYIAYLVE